MCGRSSAVCLAPACNLYDKKQQEQRRGRAAGWRWLFEQKKFLLCARSSCFALNRCRRLIVRRCGRHSFCIWTELDTNGSIVYYISYITYTFACTIAWCLFISIVQPAVASIIFPLVLFVRALVLYFIMLRFQTKGREGRRRRRRRRKRTQTNKKFKKYSRRINFGVSPFNFKHTQLLQTNTSACCSLSLTLSMLALRWSASVLFGSLNLSIS